MGPVPLGSTPASVNVSAKGFCGKALSRADQLIAIISYELSVYNHDPGLNVVRGSRLGTDSEETGRLFGATAPRI